MYTHAAPPCRIILIVVDEEIYDDDVSSVGCKKYRVLNSRQKLKLQETLNHSQVFFK